MSEPILTQTRLPNELPISLGPGLAGLKAARARVPELLYLRGQRRAFSLLEKLPEKGLAVVGTRRPLLTSLQRTRRWIHSLEGTDLVIVSGFAQGIDACAHEAALEAGIPTVAVLGTGFDVEYPRGHGDLRERILSSGGLLVTEHAPGAPARPGHFPERNRLIAALSSAVLVVEARYRSGALNTATWARQLGVPLFVVPCSPGDPAFSGNQRLIERGEGTDLSLFWGARSLGSVWLGLSSHEERMGGQKPRSGQGERGAGPTATEGGLSQDERDLLTCVDQLTRSSGGAAVESLVNWALAERQWTPERFFSVLQRTLSLGRLRDNGGFLTV